MFANKQIIISIKFIAILVFVTATTGAQWVVDDRGCRTPDLGVGDCIPIRSCKPIMDIIQQQTLTDDIIELVRSYYCGYQDKSPKVCCPFGPILNPKEPTKPATPDLEEHKNLNLLPSNCGPINDESRIYNGNKTGLFEFPWMALLSYRIRNNIDFRCGGTIINKWYVLTAAHCITNLTGLTLIGIRLGEHNIDTRSDCTEIDRGVSICAPAVQDIPVGESIPHPDYDPTTFSNDIGLVRLAWPINTTVDNAMPICLPITNTLRSIQLSAHNYTVTGWGITETGKRSPELLKVDVPVIKTENCLKAYANSNAVVTSDHVCAGGENGDSCSGDSGGPFQRIDVIDGDVRYIQFGIVSYGPKYCGKTRYPGVYTRVDRYLRWILDNIRP